MNIDDSTRTNSVTSSALRVSILMPVQNEGQFIEGSLRAVMRQDYPHELMEVIVADGMSIDNTREIVGILQAKADFPITLIDNFGLTAPMGLNASLAHANGDIVIRIDGHCIVADDYVRQCVDLLAGQGVEGVGGPIDTIGDNSLSEAIAIAMSSPFGVGGSAFRTVKDRELFVDTVPFPAYPRSVIEATGPFDEEFVRNQDDEYNYRIRGLGGKILLSPQIKSHYFSRGSLRSLWKQYFQYGLWKVRVLQKHPRQMQLRQFVPSGFVAVLFGAALLAPFSRAGRSIVTTISGCYILVNLVASTWTAHKRGWRHMPLLPVLYAILHLSYGFGFLLGLAKFWNRWFDKNNKMR